MEDGDAGVLSLVVVGVAVVVLRCVAGFGGIECLKVSLFEATFGKFCSPLVFVKNVLF